MTRNDRLPLYNRTSTSDNDLLPTQNAHAQFRPRSAFGHREDLGRLAARQAFARRAGDAEKGEDDMHSGDELEMQDTRHSDDERLLDGEQSGLTAAERDKMHSQKRKRRRVDESTAGDEGAGWSEDEEKGVNRFVVRRLLINGLFIALWYLFSISISLYNKWMFKEERPVDAGDGQEGIEKPAEPVFPFPLFTTCAHMLVQFGLAALVMTIFPRFRPWRAPAIKLPNNNQRIDEEGETKKEPLMTPWFYFTRIAPCGLATGTDIGLGNMSLKFISLTFYTMCKSSVLGFVLVFAFIFRLEKPTWKLVTIIIIMTVGVIMMVAGETAFDGLGFALVMTAAASSGFRWSLTQILLLRNRATSNPFASIFFLAPVMFVALLIIAIPVEGPFAMAAGLDRLARAKGTLPAALILIFPGCLAFLMTASEFALLQRSSVVTLSIAGIFKEIVTITAASLAYEDKLTPINISGLFVTIAAIAVYNWMKITKMRNEARMQAHVEGADYQPVLGDEDGSGMNGHANGKSRDAERRDSTASLIRSSLSMGGPQSPAVEMPTNRISPTKRPEDHD